MVVVTVSGVAPSAQQRGVAVAGPVREAQGVLVAANPERATRRITWAVAVTLTGLELETDDPDRRPYTLVFEPVEGRLLSVVRR